MKRRKKLELSELQIESLVVESLKSTGYLVINKSLIKQFGIIGASILSMYIDKYRYYKKNYSKNKGWFFFLIEEQKEVLGIGGPTIRKWKKKFIEDGILISKRKGNPSKEWLKFDFTQLMRLLQLYEQNSAIQECEGQAIQECEGQAIQECEGQAIQECEGLYNNNKNRINKNRNNISLSDQKNKPSSKERSKQYLPLAKQLAQSIQKVKNIKHTSQQLNTWTNDIRRLVENNEIDPKRIKKALNWYDKNIGGEYIPVIESGSSLRNKFIKLENAIERSRNKPSKSTNTSGSRNWSDDRVDYGGPDKVIE
jgi:hypothetical protein